MSSHDSAYRRMLSRIQFRFARARPGSVLIMVVALLVLIALIGTAYLTTALTDRYSAQQNSSNTEVELLLQGVINMVNATLVQDLYAGGQTPSNYRAASPNYVHLTGAGTIDTMITKGGVGRTPQPWLGDRTPLTPSMQSVPAQPTAPTAIGKGNAPFWAFISAPPTGPNWTFEAPYSTAGPSFRYTSRTNLQPTFISIPSGNAQQLFPALYDGTNTCLAADADGDGIADTGLFRLPVGQINGVTYYAGVRIIDNAAAINASVAMTWPSEAILNPPTTFFPTSVDLPSLAIPSLNNNEIYSLIYGYRTGLASTPTAPTPGPTGLALDDTGSPRSDFSYANITTSVWCQLGRRLENPGYVQRSSDSAIVQCQALPAGESALLARKFILRDPSNGSYAASNSILEQYLPSSVFGNPTPFQTSQYNDPVAWFANNFNYATPPTANNMPIRALLTVRNGVTNFAPSKFRHVAHWSAAGRYFFGDMVTGSDGRPYVAVGAPPLPATATNVGAPLGDPTQAANSQSWAAEPWTNSPTAPTSTAAATKTSANTATFAQLWAAYWSVMWDNALYNTNSGAAGVPLGCDTTMFRPSVRFSGVAMTPRQMLVLRSALAAVNTLGLRNSANKRNGIFGDVISRAINIPGDNGADPMPTVVFSGEANPYLTEVFADNSSGPNGYVAIELYNPFPKPIQLTNWQMASITRGGAVTPNGVAAGIIVPPISWASANPTSVDSPSSAPTIPANGFLVLANRPDPPAYVIAPPVATIGATGSASPLLIIPALSQLLAGNGNEFMLFRPRQAAGNFPLTSVQSATDPGSNYAETAADPSTLVPVDSYDFTGLGVNQATLVPQVWHYVRPNSAAAHKSWHFVYPGPYQTAVLPLNPRLEWTTGWMHPGLAFPVSLASLGAPDPAALNWPFDDFSLQIGNLDFGGPNQLLQNGNLFPYGGFARNADLLQVPFIGAYTINNGACVEINPLSMDAAFAEDTDRNDDLAENVGRFCPIYHPDTIGPPSLVGSTVADDFAPQLIGDTYSAFWRYHWVFSLFDYLTVQAPHDDYFPDVDPAVDSAGNPSRYVYWNGTGYAPIGPVLPVANANTSVANARSTNPANATEDSVPVQGLININTANWKVLSTLPMVVNNTMAGGPIDAAKNAELAQAIVWFRDVDDGFLGPGIKHPHGPFRSIYELNLVFVPGTALGFRNAMGYLDPLGGPLDDVDGDLSPYNPTIASRSDVSPPNTVDGVFRNFEQQFAVLNRVSNLITTRSDSFTVYVIVQGFRNIGTSAPQLVVQRRAAFIADRSGVTPLNSNISSLNVPVN